MQAGLSQPDTGPGHQARSAKWTTTWTISPPIRSYAELQEQLHRDLVAQHPEWIDSNGNSPMLDWYDRRLAELIAIFQSADKRPMKRRVKPIMNVALAA